MDTKNKDLLLVLVTAPDQTTARTLARAALEAHLVACANIIPQVESHYWWEGEIETSDEYLVLFKTIPSNLAALEDHIIKNHPYDVPEFIALNLSAGSQPYLDWLRNECHPASEG